MGAAGMSAVILRSGCLPPRVLTDYAVLFSEKEFQKNQHGVFFMRETSKTLFEKAKKNHTRRSEQAR